MHGSEAPADMLLRECYSSSDGGYLLVLLISGLGFAALAFAMAFPFGVASALAASVIFGAVSIALAGAWLAFAAERRNRPRRIKRSVINKKQHPDRSEQLEPTTPPAV